VIIITLNDISLNIKGKPIEISDKYTLIRGNFNLENLEQFQDKFFEIFAEFNRIDLKNILNYLNNKNLSGTEKSINLLGFLRDLQENSLKNSEIIKKNIEILSNMNEILDYKILKQRVNSLKNQVKIAEYQKESNELSAKTDLIEKLRKNLEENKKRLEYLKEDFYKIKNQRDQIQDTIDSYKSQIKKFNQKKKENFDLINKITRQMETKDNNAENVTEKIMHLRKEAKNYHYKVNNLKKELVNSRNNLQEIEPQFQSTKKDFESLKKEIEEDREKIQNLENQVKNLLKESEPNSKFLQEIETYSIKNPLEIRKQLNIYQDRLDYLEKTSSILNYEKINLDKFQASIKEFQEKKEIKTNLELDINLSEIKKTIDAFSQVELYIDKIKSDLNLFLKQINLETSFSILITKNFDKFYLDISFVRSRKEHIKFEQLTTPEKVYFVIGLYISFNLVKHEDLILFSNLILPDEFNKRGSLYRTIRKILPLFTEVNELKKYQLIFLISNLEMKRPIKNIKIVNID
jgi:predicted  nucleic acid-binding Zn-ribbon protein